MAHPMSSRTAASPIWSTAIRVAGVVALLVGAVLATLVAAAEDAVAVPLPPSPPSITSVTAGDGQLTVAFTAPSSDGGSPVLYYEYRLAEVGPWASATTSSSPFVITGLTNDVQKYVQVRAWNAIGASSQSNTGEGTPRAPSISISGANPRTLATGGTLGPPIFSANLAFSSSVTFSASAPLPAGMTLLGVGRSALLSGTPTQTGTFTFTVTAAEGALTATSALFTLIVTGGGGTSSEPVSVVLPPAVAELVTQPAVEPITTTVAPTTTTTTTVVSAGPSVVEVPAVGAVPSLVTEAEASTLEQSPGAGGVIIDGESVATEVVRVVIPAAEVAPEERTPTQVAAIQRAGADLVEEFNEVAPEGSDPLVTVTNTETGAVVSGVLVDPRDGETPVPVPVEDVIMVSAAETRVLLAAATGDGVPEEVTGGVLEVTEGGVVSALAYGLPSGVAGEVVVFSMPTLLGSFTTGGDGSFAGQLTLPELAPGAHTLVLTAGGVTSSLGLVVVGDGATTVVDTAVPTPTPGELPSTGDDHNPVTLAVAASLIAVGGVLVTRRRVW